MKTFHFPLEPLRVLRRQKERAALQRYARSLSVCDSAAAQLEKATTELASARELLARELNTGVSAAKMMNLRTWSMALEIHQHERKAALAEARRISQLAFQEMNAARRDREGLDRFYDKARRVHAQQMFRAEQKGLDELAMLAGSGPLQSNISQF